MFSSLRWPLALAFFCLTTACVGITEWVIFAEVRSSYLRSVEENLTQNCRMIASLMGRHMDQVALTASERRIITDEMARQSLAMSGRLCIVNWRGEVLEDSARRSGQNVRHRPEVMAALHGREDSAIRAFETGDPGDSRSIWEGVSDPTMYVAVPMYARNQVTGAIYGSRSLADLQLTLLHLRERLYLVGLISLAIALLLSLLLSRWLTSPLGRLTRLVQRFGSGHLEERSPLRSRDEVGQLARSFNAMADSLKGQHEALLRFVSDASHELKTPVASLRSGVEALEGGALEQPELRARFFGYLHRDLDRTERLIGDLLELHKLDRDALRLNLQSLPLEPLMCELGEEYAERFELVLECPENLRVVADRRRLRQVLTNLLDNAGRAIQDRAQGRVVLSASGGRIGVSDNGIGLSREHLEKIFDRFYRVDGARSRDDGGTGLGLSITRGLVEAMGGRIWAESGGPERGTSFWVELPTA